MPAYSKTTWIDGSAPAIDATNLNKMEQGIFDAFRQDGSTTMSGQLVTTAGSAATPAIAPTGDSNTGIFFPAADTIAFGEGGTEAMRINSSGQVGIGCDPTSALEVKSAQGVIKLASTTGTNSTYHKIDNTGGTLTLGIDNSTGSSQFGAGNYAGGLWHSGNYNLTFGTNNSVRMTISGGGNVGIGTTSPSGKLQIGSSSDTSTYKIFIEGSNTADTKAVFVSSAKTSRHFGIHTSTDNFFIGRDSVNSDFTISSTGNVGIGTTSPAAKLHVSEASASNSNVTIQLTNTQSGKNLILGASATAFAYQGLGNNDSFVLSDLSNLTLAAWNSSAIKFVTGTTEKARFDSNGYLLIGYTSSNGAYPLQVNGQIFATSSTIATSDGRYKKDVVALDGALDIVKALNPVQFSWKDHPVHKFNTDVPTVGFIAQEVEQALADKSYLTSIIKKSECTWETKTGETVEREVTRDVETQVTREVEREITETIDGEEVTRTVTEEVTETIIEQVTEIVTEPVKETHTEEFLGIAESNLIAILTKAVKELTAKVEALEAQLNK